MMLYVGSCVSMCVCVCVLCSFMIAAVSIWKMLLWLSVCFTFLYCACMCLCTYRSWLSVCFNLKQFFHIPWLHYYTCIQSTHPKMFLFTWQFLFQSYFVGVITVDTRRYPNSGPEVVDLTVDNGDVVDLTSSMVSSLCVFVEYVIMYCAIC